MLLENKEGTRAGDECIEGIQTINAGLQIMSFDKVISFDNLYNGLQKSQRGVTWKDSVAGYSINGLKNTYRLRQEILEGRYRISKYQRFTINEPKKREILATRIKDRQFQRSLCDNSIYEDVTKRFIRDNCACQRGRGPCDAINRLKRHLRKYYRRNGNLGYVLQCDVKSFFPSTSHKVACDVLTKYISDNRCSKHACDVIKSFIEPLVLDVLEKHNIRNAGMVAHKITMGYVYKDKTDITLPKTAISDLKKLFDSDIKGVGLGSQVSQLTELAVLNSLDHFIKEKLHIKEDVRYMDDFVLIDKDKEYLRHCLLEIEKFLEKINLKLNPKTTIRKLSQGVNFLKWRFILTDSGKIVIRKDKRCIIKQRRKMRALKRKLEAGEISIEDVRNNFRCWQAGIKKNGCHNLIMKMRKYYYELFEEGAPRWKK